MKSIGPTSEQTKMIEDAVALHQSGQLDLAEIQYKKLLNYFPDNTLLLSKLGTIALQKGKLEDGVRIIGRSLQINLNQPNAHNNLGTALKTSSDWTKHWQVTTVPLHSTPIMPRHTPIVVMH